MPSLHTPNFVSPSTVSSAAEIDQLVEDRPGEPRLEPRAHQDIGRRRAVGGGLDAQRMLRSGGHNLVQIAAEDQALVAALAFDVESHGDERRVLDDNPAALRRRHQPVAAVVLAAQHGGEEFDQSRAVYR